MRTSLPAAELAGYVKRLVANHLPDGFTPPYMVEPHIETALGRVERCFAAIDLKYYRENGIARFDHLNGDHLASFLYFLGNTVWRATGDVELPTRLFYLNKIMHGLDLFYSVEMPDIFLLVHPVGTVLGRARYSDYLVVYQNCTVGADTTVYPRFGKGVILYSRTSVLGDCDVGDNVIFAANSMLIDTSVPNDSVVAGQYPKHRFLHNRRSVRSHCFAPEAATPR